MKLHKLPQENWSELKLLSAGELSQALPSSQRSHELVANTRQTIRNIICGKDNRLLVIVGPCSIHDEKAAIDYASRLNQLALTHKKQLVVVMRTYFEKPRTTLGWKGLLKDPHLDGSFDVNEGLLLARNILCQINDLGMPTATEFLDVNLTHHLVDLISWAAIGARTTESQVHRELASALPCPVGFKNTTDGNIDVALNAMLSASAPHKLCINDRDGRSQLFSSGGNAFCHIVLRGGRQPNYDAKSIEAISKKLQAQHRPNKLMVDCSHGNSKKQHKNQLNVIDNLAAQVSLGNNAIFGVMIESFIHEGCQPLSKPLTYGQSITDECISIESTKLALKKLASAVSDRQKQPMPNLNPIF